MVREKKDGVIKVKVSLDKRVHDKIEKIAKDSGLSVPKFIAEVVEGLALDPILRLLHDDPALAREVAVKALSDYLDGKGVQVIASNVGEVELASEPEPEPEPDPMAEAKELFGNIVKALDPISKQLGIDLPTGGNGKGPEPDSSEPPPKAQGRGGGRRARPAPPRRG